MWREPLGGVVPSDTTQVFPPDDFTSLKPLVDPLTLCTRSGATDVSCLGSGCTRVAVGDYGACGICDGQLYCAGQLTALKPLGLLVDHQEAGCVISDRDELACFESSAESFVVSPWRGPFRKLVLRTMPQACVLGMDWRLRCGDVLSELEEQPYALRALRALIKSDPSERPRDRPFAQRAALVRARAGLRPGGSAAHPRMAKKTGLLQYYRRGEWK